MDEPMTHDDIRHRLLEAADKAPGWRSLLSDAADEIRQLRAVLAERELGGAAAAAKTLRYLGYTWHGGELWKPPLRGADALDAQPAAGLTFDAFRRANATRCLKWHPAGIESWSDSDWMTAIVGELGELASLIKMRNRERDGLPGNKFSPTNELIAKEAADVFTYLDLFCERNGIDLGLSAAQKFNEVSARVGFPDRIELDAQPAEGER